MSGINTGTKLLVGYTVEEFYSNGKTIDLEPRVSYIVLPAEGSPNQTTDLTGAVYRARLLERVLVKLLSEPTGSRPSSGGFTLTLLSVIETE